MTDYSSVPPLGFIYGSMPVDNLKVLQNSLPLHIETKGNLIFKDYPDNLKEIIKTQFPRINDNYSITYKKDSPTSEDNESHITNTEYIDTICIICLEGEYVITMTFGDNKEYIKYMFPGDCIILSGEALLKWKHSITVIQKNLNVLISIHNNYIPEQKPPIPAQRQPIIQKPIPVPRLTRNTKPFPIHKIKKPIVLKRVIDTRIPVKVTKILR